MIALEVSVNGRQLTLAGVPGDQMLIGATFSGQRLAEEPLEGQPKRFERYTELRVTGLTEQEHWSWIEGLPLEPGDEVRLRVVSVSESDPPATTSRRAEE